MRECRDAMMLVRADLCERLETLQDMSDNISKKRIAEQIGAIRTLAGAYGLVPVVRLAEALERAMHESASARDCPTSLYLARLRDAIGCERVDDEASRAILASVSVRFGG